MTTSRTSQAESNLSWAADPYANALRHGRGPLFLRRTDGLLMPLDVERWCLGADDADLSALRRCEGPVLDVGCGPGRLVAALSRRGHRALGIDVSEAAVARTRGLGGWALRRSVFDPLPGAGRWGTVLLADGNIGIGGDPSALLERVGVLLAPGGLLLVETHALDLDERFEVHLHDGSADAPAPGRGGSGALPAPFPWARLGTPALLRYARPQGWEPVDQWESGGRPFVALRRRGAVRPARRSAERTSQSAEAAKSAPVTRSQLPRKTSGESPV
ncbi:class I SAM-dependent methyltransferase [Streptomyces sp. NBC_01218]|uniref:methyltransferase domain-containing protein n=1 Tax=unclassified Streptomyces TaxID=2593676 RepID=UPI0023B9AE02|nr:MULTISPECIES: methyltransferase domain-containing protein [unclassified Streptomyces]WEH38796.1 methyltransferase domain-containing protein [Streptomyces sp. AM 2-1-1]WSQ50458.1 class I SAM-dependent methyltransferase [Streptomyces sp. NBC_01218]